MSRHGAQAKRVARPAPVAPPPVSSAEVDRCCWALWPADGGGWVWCRVLLPADVLERHRIGEQHAPDLKGIALAKIEIDMASERVIDRRGWRR